VKRAWWHRCFWEQRRKKQCQNAAFQNRPPKGHVPSGATTIAATQVPSFSVKRIWSHLMSITFGRGNRALSIRWKSKSGPCHVAPFGRRAGANFMSSNKTASSYCVYEMQITTRLWSSYIRFNDKTNYHATADIYICHARVPSCGCHKLLLGDYQHKSGLLKLSKSIVRTIII